METIRLTGLPQLRFAHVFGSESYHALLPVYPECIEITCISQGEILCEQEGRRFRVHAGDILCNLYDTPLHIRADSYHEHRTVCFNVPFRTEPDGAPHALLPLLTTEPSAAQRCRKLIDEIILCHTTDPGSDLKCAGLFLQLLAEISEAHQRRDSTAPDGSYRHVRRAKEYIFAHLHEPIRQKEIARHLGITPEHLCAVFRRCEGITLMTYINRIKLERIHTLIHREKLPLYRAAELFGYSDPNYVSRLYKNLFGTSITRDNSAFTLPPNERDPQKNP